MDEFKIDIEEENNFGSKKSKLLLFLLTTFHAICVCLYYSVAVVGLTIFINIPEELFKDKQVDTAKTFVPLYFTNWNYMFQTAFLTMSLVYNIMECRGRHNSDAGKKLKYYCDVMFSGVVVPSTMFVSTMFWTLFWIDRELVFPMVYDQIIPWWFNHCVHTNIIIVVLLETILQERRHPANYKLELSLNAAVGIGYAIVYYTIYFLTNRWLYNVFAIMTWWQVCLYQLFVWGIMFFYYFIQFPVNRIFHREPALDTKNGIGGTKNGVNGIAESRNGVSKRDNGIADTKNGIVESNDGEAGTNLIGENGDKLKFRKIGNLIESSNL